MTFSLQKVQVYGIEVSEPIFKRYQQYMALTIAAANTDTALDIGNLSGTFWTAALADATYGTSVATPALQALKDIIVRLGSFKNGECQELTSRVPLGPGLGVTELLSSASVGGAATEAYTVTGLATTDTILGVSPTVKGANAVYMEGYNTQVANGLSVLYSGDPGAGAKVTVAVLRATGLTPVAGEYSVSFTNGVPKYTFASGDAPTAYTILLSWLLAPAVEPVELYVP